MQYLILISVTVFFIGVVAAVIIKMMALRRAAWQSILSRKIISGAFFSTPAVKQLADFMNRQRHKKQFLSAIIDTKDFKSLMREIKDPLLKAKLHLMTEGVAMPVKKNDALYCLMQGELFGQKGQYDNALAALNKTADFKLNTGYQGLKALLTARIALSEGDLQAASVEAAAALKIFRRQNWWFEEAAAYFLQGLIYRVAGIFDTAEVMLRSALKLYRSLTADRYEAETLAALGLLMALRERFDEADDYLDKAAKIFASAEDCENLCFVHSQQALTFLQRGESKTARQVLRKNKTRNQSEAASAFTEEVAARTEFADKKWQKAIVKATGAADKYLRLHNFSAAFECLYLVAEALFYQQKVSDAEIVLRRLIRKASCYRSCFHIANAYTLLGLILLRQDNIKQARGVFNQALKYELSDERDIGIAVDYANLALAEKKCGNLSAAHKNLEAALAYAQTIDEDLYNRIKTMLD